MKRVYVSDLKELVREIWEMRNDIISTPMNATIYFDDEYNFSVESDLYSHEDQYKWGRLEDSLDYFNIDTDKSMTANVKEICFADAMTVTESCNDIIRENERIKIEEKRLEKMFEE